MRRNRSRKEDTDRDQAAESEASSAAGREPTSSLSWYRLWRTAPLWLLLIVHGWVFRGHYAGTHVPPFDFRQAYHSHSVAWFEDGSFFDPPLWFPWGDMGFPAATALQSGGFYLPLAILDTLGVDYTLTVASALHALHILLGALGVYVLLRQFGTPRGLAALGALAFHFSAGFYSNHQHVDIVRGSALLPWLLVAFSYRTLGASPWFLVIGGVLTFQMLIAAYPGIVIAAGYATACWIALELWAAPPYLRIPYLRRVTIAGLSGVAMSMLKWLPALILLPTVQSELAHVSRLSGDALSSLFFQYEPDFLTGSLAMRTAWLPPLILLAPFFVRSWSRMVGAGTVLLSLGLVASCSPSWFGFLPGVQISRFPIADWRAVWHVGAILVAVGALRQVKMFRARELVARSLLCLISVHLILRSARSQGFGWGDLDWELVGIAGALLLLLAHFSLSDERAGLRRLVLAGMILAVSVSGAAYVLRQPLTWLKPYDVEHDEVRLFGESIKDLLGRDRVKSWPSRGERLVWRPKRVLRGSKNRRYLKAWYGQEFSLLGYNNQKRFPQYHAIREALANGDTRQPFLRFMTKKSRIVVLRTVDDFDLLSLKTCSWRRLLCWPEPGVSIRMESFGTEGSVYLVKSDHEILVVENEMWFEGWRSQLCSGGQCMEGPEAFPLGPMLRAWMIPAGEWRWETRYGPPGHLASWLLFWLGVVALILGSAFQARRRERQ